MLRPSSPGDGNGLSVLPPAAAVAAADVSVVVDETEETEEVSSPSSGGTGRQRRSGMELVVRRRSRLGTPGAGRGRVRLEKTGGGGSEAPPRTESRRLGSGLGAREKVKRPMRKDGGR